MSSFDSISRPTGGLDNMTNTSAANAGSLNSAAESGSGFMGKAVAHLNRECQRGEHAPMVGGFQHDPMMR